MARKACVAVVPGGKRAKKRWSMGGRVDASLMKSAGDAMVCVFVLWVDGGWTVSGVVGGRWWGRLLKSRGLGGGGQ